MGVHKNNIHGGAAALLECRMGIVFEMSELLEAKDMQARLQLCWSNSRLTYLIRIMSTYSACIIHYSTALVEMRVCCSSENG